MLKRRKTFRETLNDFGIYNPADLPAPDPPDPTEMKLRWEVENDFYEAFVDLQNAAILNALGIKEG